RGLEAARPGCSLGERAAGRLRGLRHLLLVPLDDLRRTSRRCIGILARFTQRAPLAQQIPALVEGHLDGVEPPPVVVSRGACRLPLPELVLFGDELLDRRVNLSVIHMELLLRREVGHRQVCRFQSIRFPNESDEYRAARDALLDEEIALRRHTEAVAEQRRRLPLGGEVTTDYAFAGASGTVQIGR